MYKVLMQAMLTGSMLRSRQTINALGITDVFVLSTAVEVNCTQS